MVPLIPNSTKSHFRVGCGLNSSVATEFENRERFCERFVECESCGRREAIYANYGKEVERIFCLAARAAQWLRVGVETRPAWHKRGETQASRGTGEGIVLSHCVREPPTCVHRR